MKKKCKITPDSPKNESGLNQLLGMGKFIWLIWAKQGILQVDRASDSMMAGGKWRRSKTIHFSWLGPELFRLLLGPPGLNW